MILVSRCFVKWQKNPQNQTEYSLSFHLCAILPLLNANVLSRLQCFVWRLRYLHHYPLLPFENTCHISVHRYVSSRVRLATVGTSISSSSRSISSLDSQAKGGIGSPEAGQNRSVFVMCLTTATTLITTTTTSSTPILHLQFVITSAHVKNTP